jgi:hypothetical protein
MKKIIFGLILISSYSAYAENHDEINDSGYYICTVKEAYSTDNIKIKRKEYVDDKSSENMHKKREMGLADELSNSEDECIKLASKMLSKYVLM